MSFTKSIRVVALLLSASIHVVVAEHESGPNNLLRGIQSVANSDADAQSLNVFGKPLEACSQNGMAKTGYDRSGQCVDQEGDTGSHHICIDLSSTSLDDKNFCEVTGQSNWCAKEMPCNEDESLQCPVERWCVCQWAFAGYLAAAKGCDAIQKIECNAVNIKAVEAYEKDEEKYGAALSCLKDRCKL
eukprot:CAMPEP_0201882948 /NCGR_PEP_ID=MMETSP0902-20130614/15045_1 /ASSEMBLY_ACC=CAM_ASM_000551 /TAXON_ID=420261 /ORGANISM="Thalassiosira antarctica, Strain CCMP982" /LENGTH=186 /DNA_ID=CAMNT_0048411637 /DNA_START=22 /DNA_END=582 /DNA_ORIENTATION=+